MRRSERLEYQQNLIAFDELARLLDGLRRAVAVVIADKVDLAAVDAALGVDLAKLCSLGLSDLSIGRGRAAIGHDVPDFDFAVVRAGIVFFLRRGWAGRNCGDGQCCCDGHPMLVISHFHPPPVSDRVGLQRVISVN
jgi:hypothetical protein